jgi:violaxanthin de-epoxidase
MTGFASDVVAADTVAVGACLLRSCKKELAQCVLNPKCLANVVCLNLCNGRPDEAECQIKCGDLFENDVVGTFNACAVSQKKCVPQKANEGLYPPPSPQSTVKAFDTAMMQGRWYITAGLNKAFDTFDCQVHFFSSPSPGTILAKLNWRVTEPDGEFFTKNALQRFVQDPANPAHLANHDNEYLHYKDDWYVLDYEPDDFVLVYYMGSNDAWDGYGGAFLYSRAPALRPELVPRLRAAMARTGLKYRWEDFTVTDNSCKPTAESPTILREKFARRLFITEEAQLQEQLTAARNAAANSLFRVSTEPRDLAAAADTPASAAAREAQAQAREALRRSAEYLEQEFVEFRRELAREAAALEGEVERDLRQLEKAVIQK